MDIQLPSRPTITTRFPYHPKELLHEVLYVPRRLCNPVIRPSFDSFPSFLPLDNSCPVLPDHILVLHVLLLVLRATSTNFGTGQFDRHGDDPSGLDIRLRWRPRICPSVARRCAEGVVGHCCQCGDLSLVLRVWDQASLLYRL